VIVKLTSFLLYLELKHTNMRPLKMLTLVVCFIATIAKSQVIDPNFTPPLPIAKPEIFSAKVQSDGTLINMAFKPKAL
jgi:hypothetical protein